MLEICRDPQIFRVRFEINSGVADLDGLDLFGAKKAFEKSLAKRSLAAISWDNKLSAADDILSAEGFWDLLLIILRFLGLDRMLLLSLVCSMALQKHHKDFFPREAIGQPFSNFRAQKCSRSVVLV